MSKEKKFIEALVEKTAEGKLIAIASTETPDRMGDSIKANGWDVRNFIKNPVLLFGHKYDQPPIGIGKNIRVENGALVFEPVFHEITQLAREVKQMFEEGFLRTFSVGFIPLKFDERNSHNIIKAELLEISAVPVPANAEALIMIQKEYTPEDMVQVKTWIESEEKEMPIEEEIKEKIEEEKEKIEEEIKEEVKEEVEEIKEEAKEEEAKEEIKEEIKIEEEKKEEVKEEIKEEMKEEKIIEDIENDVNEQIIKNLEKEIAEVKEGRVLSGKNKDLVNNCLGSLQKTVELLQDLLKSGESQAIEIENLKGREKEVQKSLKDKATVRALQRMSGELSQILRKVK